MERGGTGRAQPKSLSVSTSNVADGLTATGILVSVQPKQNSWGLGNEEMYAFQILSGLSEAMEKAPQRISTHFLPKSTV